APRGGPPIVKPPADWFNVSASTDSRKRWGISFFGQGNRGAAGSWSRNATVNLRLQPSGRLQTTISVSTTNGLDIAQWIKNVDADGDGVEDNVYGTLRRHVVNLTARGTYAFSRDLTLDLFLQPFVAVGTYRDIRKLARAKSFDFTPVTIEDDPNFNRKSLRGNLV